MRRAAKRDKNEGPLVTMARELGALIVYSGPMDFWLGFHGKFYPVEIKNPKGKNRYTKSQVDFMARCAMKNLPVLTWRTPEDVLRSLGAEVKYDDTERLHVPF